MPLQLWGFDIIFIVWGLSFDFRFCYSQGASSFRLRLVLSISYIAFVVRFAYLGLLQNAYGMAVDLKAAEFTPWTTLIDPFVFDKNQPYFNIMVPTSDTTRFC